MASFPLPEFTEQKVIGTEEFQVGFKYLLLARLNIIYFNQLNCLSFQDKSDCIEECCKFALDTECGYFCQLSCKAFKFIKLVLGPT